MSPYNESVRKSNAQNMAVISAIFLLLFVSLFTYLGAPKTYAGTFSPRKLTISDSRAAQTAVTYDFAFTASATTSIKQIDIKFCTQAGAWADTCTAPTGLTTASATRSADNIAGTTRTDSQPGANSYRSVVTTPATQSTQAITYSLTGMVNPSTTNTSFFARVITYSDTGTTEIDSGTMAFATLTTTSIAVSATVLENFSFSIAGVSTAGTVNGATTNITTTATTIPFGTLTAATSYIGAHDVTVTTNAASGYAVTTKGNQTPLLQSGSQNIDEFSGTYASPATWTAPAGTAASVNTGYFGYTTEDTDFSNFQSNKWAGSETTPRAIVSDATGVSAQTTRVGWRTEVNALQPAGAYTGTIILVATPTY